jgi:Protein of unknown function (DUF2934)
MAARKERAAPTNRTPKTVSHPTPSPEEVRKLISEAAYYRAKRRGFAPGHELEDWVQAEAEVLQRLNGPRSAA